MSKKLTSEDKIKFVEASLPKLTEEQRKVVLGTSLHEARYDKVRRYLRIQKEGQKQEQHYLLDLAMKYRHILEGLECLDEKRWTDEAKIAAFGKILGGYEDKCEALINENNRRRLERLKMQRDQRHLAFKAECEKFDKEIEELEKKLGDSPYSNEVIAEVSLIP